MEFPINSTQDYQAYAQTPDHIEEDPQGKLTKHDYQQVKDRQIRTVKPPERYDHADMISYALTIESAISYDEATTVREAMDSVDKEQWLQAMKDEINSLEKNQTRGLVPNHMVTRLLLLNGSRKENKDIRG